VEQERSGGFLPPEPPGPEPELGGSPSRQPPQAQPPPPSHGWQQPPQPYPPAPGYGQPPPWGYSPPAREPDNGPVIAGFVLSLVAGGLLVFSAGLSSVISVGCAVAGLIYSRKGKRKVAAGETTKNSGLAQAGFIISIVSLVLSALATAFWLLILVLALVDEDVRQDFENEFDNSQTIRASLQLTGLALRAGAQLMG
jgi:MFS family permease